MAIFVPFGYNHRTRGDRTLGRLHAYNWEIGNIAGATDFWIDTSGIFGQNNATTAGLPLVDFGWTMTSITTQAGSAADFSSKSDIGTPASGAITNAASDLMQSPPFFGDFMHMDQAAYHLGTYPLYMMLEGWIRFATASNAEATTNYGFCEDGGSIIVNADAIAVVQSDGTNFKLSTGGDSDTGELIQTTPLGVRIKIAPGTTDKVQWWTRLTPAVGWVSQGTADLTTDEFPCCFGFGQGTSNVLHHYWTHIWYSVDGRWPN